MFSLVGTVGTPECRSLTGIGGFRTIRPAGSRLSGPSARRSSPAPLVRPQPPRSSGPSRVPCRAAPVNVTVVTFGSTRILVLGCPGAGDVDSCVAPFSRTSVTRGAMPVASHPLDSLSAEEFRRTTAALRAGGQLTPTRRFASITLDEPAKAAVLAWNEGDPIERRSLSVLWDRSDNKTYEAVVESGRLAGGAGDTVRLVRPHSRGDAELHCRRVARLRGRAEAEPEGGRSAGRAGHHRPRRWC